LDQRFNFHALRHTCLTAVYRDKRDLVLTQRVARHKNVETTKIYAIPSDDDVFAAVRALNC
jgi:integrase